MSTNDSQSSDPRHQELVEWLKSQGHTSAQIERILDKVTEYDNQTVHESLFDSIDNGNFDLATFIDEALSEEG